MYVLLLQTLFAIGCVATQCWRDTDCTGPSQAAFPGEWDKFNYAPSSRLVSPASILLWPNLTTSAYAATYTLHGNGSLVTYDFGKEVGGIVSLSFKSTGAGQIGLAFTESKKFVGEWSDSSRGRFDGYDGAIYGTVQTGNGTYTMPDKSLRGGFRYLTVFLLTNATDVAVQVSNIKLELGFQPTWSNLRAYQGYFHCSDDLLNRIWYAGAYTLQTNAVPPHTGRQIPALEYGWANNATLSNGSTVIVDGAKRDRAVWPGDMGVAVPSTFVSTGDLESVRNALQVMYDYQDPKTGAFDESGPPLSQKGSDTYHMWTMIGTYNYVLYTADFDWVRPVWAKYQHAMSFVLAKVDNSGLMNVTGLRDWARWQQGFHNTEANMILYLTLTIGSKLATWLNETDLAKNYTARASNLAASINKRTYDISAQAYKDNDTTTTLHPQDANSMSLLFSVASNTTSPHISSALLKNWTPIGPQTPELPNNISPFISSFELLGRLTVRDTSHAFTLLRTLWGWVINNPLSTESTLLEGYLTNGSFAYRNNRGYGYDESYVSHSHGWSSGPTSGLTNYVVGLDVTEPGGEEWVLAPQFGDLEYAEGGFVTTLGKFQAKWTRNSTTGVDVQWDVPVGAKGVVTVPVPVGTKDVGAWVKGCFQGGEAGYVNGTVREWYSAFGERLISFGVLGGKSGMAWVV